MRRPHARCSTSALGSPVAHQSSWRRVPGCRTDSRRVHRVIDDTGVPGVAELREETTEGADIRRRR